MPIDRQFHEAIARFFEQPTREGLRELLRTNIGELDHCDFKGNWPPLSNIARHILGFANSGGGVIVIGMAQGADDNSLQPIGLKSILDKADIDKGIRKFIPYGLMYEVLDFSYTASEYPALIGKIFQVLIIEDDPTHLPYVCCSDGQGIRNAAIYVRHGTNTEEANNDELQTIINRRVETGHSTQGEIDLQNHLYELRALYTSIQNYHFQMGSLISRVANKIDPNYPREDFDEFIAKAIQKKKRLIEKILGFSEEPL